MIDRGASTTDLRKQQVLSTNTFYKRCFGLCLQGERNRDFDSYVISGTDVFGGVGAFMFVLVGRYFLARVTLTVVLTFTVQNQTQASVIGEGHLLQGSSQ